MYTKFSNLRETAISGLWANSAVVMTVAAVITGGVVWKMGQSFLEKRGLAQKRTKKRSACSEAIVALDTKLCQTGLQTERRDAIIDSSFGEVTAKLQNGSWKPKDVLEAYQSRAIEAHHITNCLVEPIKEANEQAIALQGSNEKGALYGIPVSIKDNFGLEGYDCVCGLARWVDKPFTEDAVLVQILKKQGAIPFVKTNVPQTMISWESTNPIFGMTRNPHDPKRGVGGSSGGEGALIASKGSILGFGSDIGGSIRIPCCLNGIYGFKPTEGRLSGKGTHPILRGQNAIKAVYGPMGRDVQTLVAAMKALLVDEMFELDPEIPPMPFKDDVYNSKRPLRIGMFTYDGIFHAVPAMVRGVEVAKHALESMGHTVVPWNHDNLGHNSSKIWHMALFGDGGVEMKRHLKGDAVDSAVQVAAFLIKIPKIIKTCLFHLLKYIQPLAANTLKAVSGSDSVAEWWDLNIFIKDFRDEIMKDLKRGNIDALICPGFGCTALPVGKSALASAAASYTQLYNVLNFPAGSLPVTKVQQEDIDNLSKYPTPNPWHTVVKQCSYGSLGLPINVQVATLPWQEEKCLRIMKDLSAGLTQLNKENE